MKLIFREAFLFCSQRPESTVVALLDELKQRNPLNVIGVIFLVRLLLPSVNHYGRLHATDPPYWKYRHISLNAEY